MKTIMLITMLIMFTFSVLAPIFIYVLHYIKEYEFVQNKFLQMLLAAWATILICFAALSLLYGFGLALAGEL
jgi:hypothetical protein